MNQRSTEEEVGKSRPGAAEGAIRTIASAMVSAMPRERRTVLALAIVQKLSYHDIARQLSLPEHQVKAHMREALTLVYRDVIAPPAVLGSPRNLNS